MEIIRATEQMETGGKSPHSTGHSTTTLITKERRKDQGGEEPVLLCARRLTSGCIYITQSLYITHMEKYIRRPVMDPTFNLSEQELFFF